MTTDSPVDPERTKEVLMALIGERVLETGSNFTAESDLFAAGLDSIAIMQLLLAIEEEFNVQIPLESVSRKNFQTVSAVTQLVTTRLNGGLAVESPATPAEAEAPAAQVPPPAPTVPEALPPLSPTVAAPFESAPLRHCDYFVLSFDAMSRRTGQGGHKAHSILVLDRLPDVERLRALLQAATDLFPMLTATVHRRWLIGVPEWRPAKQPVAPELKLYSEEGSAGRLSPLGAESFTSADTLLDTICNTPIPRPQPGGWTKARFHLLETRDSRALLVFSWSHLMCDGVGAELFLQELERISSGSREEPRTPMPQPQVQSPTFAERWSRAKPIVRHFRNLVMQKFDCLGPRKAVPGKTHFKVHTLTKEQTSAATAKCAQVCGGLVTMPFYLACSMRAHEKVFTRRGLTAPSYVCTVPVQTRRKGASGPIFQNHVTMFLGSLRREELATLEGASRRLMEEHAQFVKDKLGDALNDLMHTMRFMPPRLYMAFISKQMRGPFASFFHSHTGEFAAGMDSFLGAQIQNAYHIPGIATPPGTGIFCNEKSGRLVITLCWHEDALDATEQQMLLEAFLAELGVE